MGLLNEMTKSNGVASENTARSLRESVINAGARIADEGNYDSEWDTVNANLKEMLESDDEKAQYEAGLTYLMVQRTQDFLEAAVGEYGESTVTQSLGSLPKRVLDVVRIFYPNQIATELVDIQPIDGKVGEIFTLKPRFSDDFDNISAGDEVFKVRATNENYASEEVVESLGTGDGSTTTFAGNLGTLEVRPGTVKITAVIAAATVVVVDDGNGNLLGVALSTAGTINYVTGAYSIDFSTAPDNATDVSSVYCYDSEKNDGATIRSVEYDMETTPVVAKMHPLTFKYSVAGALAAKAHLAVDTNETLAELAAQYIKNERDEYLVKLINANANSVSSLNFDATPAAGFSKQSKYAEIELKLDEAESQIQAAAGRGGVDWVLCGRNAANIMRNMRGFKAAPVSAPIGSHVIGTVRDGSVTIVKSLTLDVNAMIFGYKGYMAGDSATILAEWIPIYFTPTFQAPRLYNEQGVMSMYDMFVNNSDYYVKGTVSNYSA